MQNAVLAQNVRIGDQIELKTGRFVTVTGIKPGVRYAPLRANDTIEFEWMSRGRRQTGTVYAASVVVVRHARSETPQEIAA